MNKKLTSGKSREYARLLRAAWREKNPGVHLSSEDDESDDTLIISSDEDTDVEVVNITTKGKADDNNNIRPRGTKIIEEMKLKQNVSIRPEDVRDKAGTTSAVRHLDEKQENVRESPAGRKAEKEVPLSSRKFKKEMEKVLRRLEEAEKRDALAKKFRDKARKLMLGKFEERAKFVEVPADRRQGEGESIINYLEEEGLIGGASSGEVQEEHRERVVIRLPNRPVSRTPSPEEAVIKELHNFAEESQRNRNEENIGTGTTGMEKGENQASGKDRTVQDWKLMVNPQVVLERIKVPKPKKKKPRIISSQKVFIRVKIAKPSRKENKVKEGEKGMEESLRINETEHFEQEEKIPILRPRRVRPNVLRDLSSDEEDKKAQKIMKKLHHKKRAKFVSNYRANLELQGEMYTCIKELGEIDAAEAVLDKYEKENELMKKKLQRVCENKENVREEYASSDTSATMSNITALVPYIGCPFRRVLKEQEGGMQPNVVIAKPNDYSSIKDKEMQEDADSLHEWVLSREDN